MSTGTTTNTSLPSAERPWLRYFPPEVLQEPLPTCTIYEQLVANNHAFHDNTAILFKNVRIDFGSLLRHIDECARALLAVGIKRNDIVTVAMPGIPEMLYAFYAINRIGAIANMIHPLASREEICFYLNEVKSRVFIMYTGTYDMMHEALSTTTVEKAIVVSPVQSLSLVVRWIYQWKTRHHRFHPADNVLSWTQFIRQGKQSPLPSPCRADDDLALISHTGGTTGSPKGVVCTNGNVTAQMVQHLHHISVTDRDRDKCSLASLPPFINYSLVNMILEPLSLGLSVALVPDYQPQEFLTYLNRYHFHLVGSIPPYLEAILSIPGIRQADLSPLILLGSGGERMEEETEKQLNSLLSACGAKIQVMKGVGMTEFTSAATLTTPEHNALGCVGIPLFATNCKIIDVNSGDELTYNQEGEICFAGPTLMACYYGHPEATAAIIRSDADGVRWLHTGDLGYITPEGMVYLTGRLKRLILTRDDKGVIAKIFPDRIEKVIETHPAVNVCCVVGKPHTGNISLPKAFVELKKAHETDQTVIKELLQRCREELPLYMVPTEIVIIDQMPRTTRGKVDYRKLE